MRLVYVAVCLCAVGLVYGDLVEEISEIGAAPAGAPTAGKSAAKSAGKTVATAIKDVTASNFYNAAASPNKAADNNPDTFWSTQLGQSNAYLSFRIHEGKPLHHVKSIQVKYYGKRSARLTKLYYRCEKGRTLSLVDNRPFVPMGKLGDLKKSIQYKFKISDDIMFTKTKKETSNKGRASDCFDVFDKSRDMTEGQGTHVNELMVRMEGAQTQLNGQDVLSISEINYSSKTGCKGAQSIALNRPSEE